MPEFFFSLYFWGATENHARVFFYYFYIYKFSTFCSLLNLFSNTKLLQTNGLSIWIWLYKLSFFRWFCKCSAVWITHSNQIWNRTWFEKFIDKKLFLSSSGISWVVDRFFPYDNFHNRAPSELIQMSFRWNVVSQKSESVSNFEWHRLWRSYPVLKKASQNTVFQFFITKTTSCLYLILIFIIAHPMMYVIVSCDIMKVSRTWF